MNDSSISSPLNVEMTSQEVIRLEENQYSIIGKNLKSHTTVNCRIANIVERYAVVVSESLPDLSNNEWLAISDWYAGPVSTTGSIDHIASGIHEDAHYLDEKWSIDTTTLEIKVASMSFHQKAAIAEFLDRFWLWNDPGNGASDFVAMIDRIKESFKRSYFNGLSNAMNW